MNQPEIKQILCPDFFFCSFAHSLDIYWIKGQRLRDSGVCVGGESGPHLRETHKLGRQMVSSTMREGWDWWMLQ